MKTAEMNSLARTIAFALIITTFMAAGYLIGCHIDYTTGMASRYGIMLPLAGLILGTVSCCIDALITRRHGMIFFTD